MPFCILLLLVYHSGIHNKCCSRNECIFKPLPLFVRIRFTPLPTAALKPKRRRLENQAAPQPVNRARNRNPSGIRSCADDAKTLNCHKNTPTAIFSLFSDPGSFHDRICSSRSNRRSCRSSPHPFCGAPTPSARPGIPPAPRRPKGYSPQPPWYQTSITAFLRRFYQADARPAGRNTMPAFLIPVAVQAAKPRHWPPTPRYTGGRQHPQWPCWNSALS